MKGLDLSANNYPLIIPGSASHLTKLVLDGCRQIIKIPDHVDNIHNFSYFDARLLDFSVYAGDTISNIYLLEHASPDELQISQLENVKSTEEAHNINLSEKQTILSLALLWTKDASRSVDDMELLTELVPPTTLQRFVIKGYCSVGFPDWVMSISNHLPHLVELRMQNLPNCKSLPPLGQLPNLQKLALVGMESLEEWDTSYLCALVLEIVTIYKCPKLRIRTHLPRAASWYIVGSDNVLLPQRECVSHIDCLTIGFTEWPLHRWGFLHHILSLGHLRLDGCNDLMISSRISRALHSLKSLVIFNCSHAKLEELFGGLWSLQELTIWDHKMLEELPNNMRQLTKLQSLTLYLYPSLR
jgi:hypothetical protein